MTQIEQSFLYIERECKFMARDQYGNIANTAFADRVIEDVTGVRNFCSLVLSSTRPLATISKAVRGPYGDALLLFFNVSFHDSRVEMVLALAEATRVKQGKKKSTKNAYRYLISLYRQAVKRAKKLITGSDKSVNTYKAVFSSLANFANMNRSVSFDPYFDDFEDEDDFYDGIDEDEDTGLMTDNINRKLAIAAQKKGSPLSADERTAIMLGTDDFDDEDDDDEDEEEALLSKLSDAILMKMQSKKIPKSEDSTSFETLEDFLQKQGIEYPTDEEEDTSTVEDEDPDDKPLASSKNVIQGESILSLTHQEPKDYEKPPLSEMVRVRNSEVTNTPKTESTSVREEVPQEETSEEADSESSYLPPEDNSGGSSSIEIKEDTTPPSNRKSNKRLTKKQRKAQKRLEQQRRMAEKAEDKIPPLELDRNAPDYIDKLMDPNNGMTEVERVAEILSNTPEPGKPLEINFPKLSDMMKELGEIAQESDSTYDVESSDEADDDTEDESETEDTSVETSDNEETTGDITEVEVDMDDTSEKESNLTEEVDDSYSQEVLDTFAEISSILENNKYNYLHDKIKTFFFERGDELVDVFITVRPSYTTGKIVAFDTKIHFWGDPETLNMRKLYNYCFNTAFGLMDQIGVSTEVVEVVLSVVSDHDTFDKELTQYYNPDGSTPITAEEIRLRDAFISAVLLTYKVMSDQDKTMVNGTDIKGLYLFRPGAGDGGQLCFFNYAQCTDSQRCNKIEESHMDDVKKVVNVLSHRMHISNNFIFAATQEAASTFLTQVAKYAEELVSKERVMEAVSNLENYFKEIYEIPTAKVKANVVFGKGDSPNAVDIIYNIFIPNELDEMNAYDLKTIFEHHKLYYNTFNEVIKGISPWLSIGGEYHINAEHATEKEQYPADGANTTNAFNL